MRFISLYLSFNYKKFHLNILRLSKVIDILPITLIMGPQYHKYLTKSSNENFERRNHERTTSFMRFISLYLNFNYDKFHLIIFSCSKIINMFPTTLIKGPQFNKY